MSHAPSGLVIQGMPVVVVDGEPRLSHVDVAKVLGYVRSKDLVKLIDAHRARLESFGILPLAGAKIEGRGRPGKIYLLSQKQTLFLCARSDQEIAQDVTVQMVHVFDEALRTRRGPVASIFHRLLAPAPTEWDLMFTPELVKALVVLDRQTWDGGSHPRYLRSTYNKIYDMVVGSEVWAEMARRAQDPAFLHARKHQQLAPGPRQAFRGELEFVRLLADQSRTKDEFWARMERRYGDGTLQLTLGEGFDALETAS